MDPHEKNLSLPLVTPQMMGQAVIYDGQSRFWFRKLLTVPAVVDSLSLADSLAVPLFRERRVFFVLSRLFTGMAAVTSIVSIQWAAWRLSGLVLSAGLFAAALYFVHRERKALSSLVSRLIQVDGPAFPAGATFYQVSEIYSRKYGIASIVDMLGMENRLLRNTAFAAYLAATGVYFLPLWSVLLWIGAACFLAVVGARYFIFSQKLTSAVDQRVR